MAQIIDFLTLETTEDVCACPECDCDKFYVVPTQVNGSAHIDALVCSDCGFRWQFDWKNFRQGG